MSSLFDGRWRIDLTRSTVWDAAAGGPVPDRVGDEVITLSTVDGVQDYEVRYGDDPTVVMGYASRLDDPGWVPYLVRDVIGPGSVEDFRRRIRADTGPGERDFTVGRPYGMVRTVYADERTHYRISRSPQDGSAQSVMMRRLAADGRSYLASVLDTDGIVFRTRWFVRDEG